MERAMRVLFTIHARIVIQEREIPEEYIRRVIRRPDWVMPDSENPDLEHYLGKIDELNGRVLRVVLKKTVDFINVITVYYDRTMRGKI
jgi:hypothetical protein